MGIIVSSNPKEVHTPNTPAFVLSEHELARSVDFISDVCTTSHAKLFFPLKCHTLNISLKIIVEYVDGFAASSLFEAQLARETLGQAKKVHFTSPGLRDKEMDELLNLCDGISFNSLSQWDQNKEKALGRVTCGLRVNPQLSFVKDERYDPCKPQSRLGAPLDKLQQAFAVEPGKFTGLEGIHFHTNCDSKDWSPLLKTVQHLDCQIPGLLKQCRWINLGGGYLLNDDTDFSPFHEAVRLLQDKYGLEVIIEPGAAVVRDACVLVSQVTDIFESGGKEIAVLDTTVNHLPEVFEYQFNPDVIGDTENGDFCYILAGSTCLSGDVFGEYCFETPLQVGSRVIFSGVGAYTLVKAHMFNGINLPSVYALTASGELELKREYNYQDFKSRCGAEPTHESIRDTAQPAGNSEPRKSA